MKLPTEPIKLHFFYVVVIFVLILVWVTTWALADSNTVLSHISLASSIASLVLAVLAIVYAFVSNASFSSSLGQLSQTSDELADNAEHLTEIRDDLTEYVDAIRHIRTSVDAQGQRFEEFLQNFPQEFALNPESVDLPEIVIDKFLGALSFKGLLLLYVIYLAYSTSKEFSFWDVLEKTNTFWEYKTPLDAPELYAYLDVFSALGLVEVKIYGRGPQSPLPPGSTVSYLHPSLGESIKKKKSEGFVHFSTPTSAARYGGDVLLVEEYFGVSPKG